MKTTEDNYELVQYMIKQIIAKNTDDHVDIDEDDDSPLYEMASLGKARLKSKGKSWFVAVHYDPDRRGDPYFRFYSTPQYSKNAPAARISFIEARYIIHPKADNKHFNLDPKQKKALMKFMNSKSTKNGYEGYTNWQTAIMKFNDEAVQDKPGYLKWQQCTRAFMEANKRLFSRGQLKNALPIDLPMPDYTQLPEE